MIGADQDGRPGEPRGDGAPASSAGNGPDAARLAAIGERAEKAVVALREAADPVDRLVRYEGPELLDLDHTPNTVKQRILEDVERITEKLQLHRYWVWRLGKQIVEARRTRRGRPVRVLDVGCGSGALLFRIGAWAQRNRIPIELHGVDRDPGSITGARIRAGEEGMRAELRVGDARRLDGYADDSVDVAVTTFVLHHLSPGDAACVLAELDRVAAVNFLAFDLRRTVLAIPAAWAFLHLGRFDAPTRHDGLAAVRRGFTLAETEALVRAAGIANARVTPILPSFLATTRA